MTVKELYNKGFESAILTLCYESDYYITSIEVIKDFIKKVLDEDNFIWAEHLIVALNNTDAYYYEYDFSAGTFETPKPLTELEDLEEYCDDYKGNMSKLEMVLKNEHEICSNLEEITGDDIDTSYQYLITILSEELQKNAIKDKEYEEILGILDDLSLFWIDALSKALDYIYELGDKENG